MWKKRAGVYDTTTREDQFQPTEEVTTPFWKYVKNKQYSSDITARFQSF
jgi:hypothetical protein